jgi:colanic acid/amylovoran/stewartan biosynthesis glycosyltransferase WcaL/AmsK/CpsK
MKICVFVNFFPSLSETFVLNQIVGMLQRGHDVEIHAYSAQSDDVKQHPDVGCWQLIGRTRYPVGIPSRLGARTMSGVGRLAWWGWRRPVTALDSLNFFKYGRRALNLTLLHDRFPAEFTRRSFDVIHCNYGPNGKRALALRKAGVLKGPIVTTFHGYDANHLPKVYGAKMYRELFEETELFTVGSEFMRRQILSLGAPSDRVIKLPLGVDLSKFKYSAPQRAGREFRLLTVARLVEVKGIEYALRAIACVRADAPQIRYTIVGEGPLRGPLEELARSLSINDIVTFEGAMTHDEVEGQLALAHAFVLPSIVTESGEEENQPLVLAESQACGVPVIATNIGGVSESIIDRVTGLLVPPGNENSLASAIIELMKDSFLRECMGRAGRKFVQNAFNLEIQNDKLVEVYKSVRTAWRKG